jgi:hypothetical protein
MPPRARTPIDHTGHHLAQVNVSLPQAPLDSAAMAGFVAALRPVNALADAAPGFVWRLQTADGDATGVRLRGDRRLLVNLSVWVSLEALADFVFRTAHVSVMRDRRQWFVPTHEPSTALWWVEAGTLPTVPDADTRLTHLREHGPSRYAFTFRTPFPPARQVTRAAPRPDR